MALDRYPFFAHQVRDRSGGIVPAGTQVSVVDADTSEQALLYKDNGANAKTNPLVTDDNGVVWAFVSLKTRINLIVLAPSGQYSLGPFAADTVQDHRLTGDHAAGTITAEQLAFTITDVDVAVHAAMESGTHGLAANENFVHTVAGTASGSTDSPTLDDVHVTKLHASERIHGYRVCNPTIAAIQAAVDAANDGDTIWIKGDAPGGTPEIDTTAGTVLINKNLSIVALGTREFNVVGANYVFTVNADAITVELANMSLNRTSGNAGSIRIRQAKEVTLRNMILKGALGNAHEISTVSTGSGIQNIYMYNVQAIPAASGGSAFSTVAGGYDGKVIVVGGLMQNANATFYGVDLDDGSSDHKGGVSFFGTTFRGASKHVRVDVPDVRFLGCYFNDTGGTAISLLITANGTNCFADTVVNTFNTGTISDASNNLSGIGSTWDYDSGVVTLDNSGATFEDEFLVQSFTHNLGGRQLEANLLLANTVGFDDVVWTLTPGVSFVFNTNPQAPGGQFYSLALTTDNVAKLTLYAGRSVSGGVLSATKKWIWNAADPRAIVGDVQQDVYSWQDAGGLALDKVFLRLRLRRMT